MAIDILAFPHIGFAVRTVEGFQQSWGRTLGVTEWLVHDERPTGRLLEPLAQCGESITWEDDKLVQVTVRVDQSVPFHTLCFEHYRCGLNLFAELVLDGSDPKLVR